MKALQIEPERLEVRICELRELSKFLMVKQHNWAIQCVNVGSCWKIQDKTKNTDSTQLRKANNIKHSKTKLPWLLPHTALKPGNEVGLFQQHSWAKEWDMKRICERDEFLSLEWKTEGVIDGESEGDDCDEVIHARRGEQGWEWTGWGWRN